MGSYNNPLTQNTEWAFGYDSDTRTFSGNPGDFAVGTYYYQLRANERGISSGTQTPDDLADSFVYSPVTTVKITVLNEYDAPVLIAPIADKVVMENNYFQLYSSSAFYKIDRDQTLTYAFSLANGAALPSWLQFDTASGVLYGTPGSTQVGSYSIRVTATDIVGSRLSDEFDLTVALSPDNHAPLLVTPVVDQIYRSGQDFSFQVPRNTFAELDPGDSLTYQAVQDNGNPLPSWVSFNASTLVFSGAVPIDQRAPTEIRLIAKDGSGATAFDVFSLGIDEKGLPPIVAEPVADQSTDEDGLFSFALPQGLFNDPSPATGMVLSATLFNGSALPTWLSFNAVSGQFEGTPLNEDVGVLQVRVTATKPGGAQASDVFQLTVRNTNDAPLVAGESFVVDGDGVLRLSSTQLLANDSDVDPTYDTLVVSSVSDAQNGSVSLSADGQVVFAADPSYQGPAAFSYTVGDGHGGFTTGQVLIDVYRQDLAPVALDASVQLQEDASHTFTIQEFGFSDSDGPAQALSVVVSAPSVGTLLFNGVAVLVQTVVQRADVDAGLLVFSPAENANGNGYATLSFRVDNGKLSDNIGVLSLDVLPVNDGPNAQNDHGAVEEDALQPLTGSLLDNDSDIDAGTSLSVRDPGSFVGNYGTLILEANGAYSYQLNNGLAQVQSLALGERLEESFDYSVTDGEAQATAKLTVTITGTNDLPGVQVDSGWINEEDRSALEIHVLANDHDVDHGSVLAIANPGGRVGLYGQITVGADGAALYQLDNELPEVQSLGKGQELVDHFVVQVGDGFGWVDSAIDIHIQGQNDAPVSVADAALVQEDGQTQVSGNLLSNDTDVDHGTVLELVDPGVRKGMYGTLTVDASGAYSYELDNALSAVQALAQDAIVTESFSYEVSDMSLTATSQLLVSVRGTNDGPID